LYFLLSYLPEETCFQQAGSSAVEGTSQAVLGSSHQPKVPASLSLFLKSEKIPALLYLGVTVCNTQVLNGFYNVLQTFNEKANIKSQLPKGK
jgi:hypothetical protein